MPAGSSSIQSVEAALDVVESFLAADGDWVVNFDIDYYSAVFLGKVLETEDADILLCAWGTCGRICRSVVEEGRKQGIKVGMGLQSLTHHLAIVRSLTALVSFTAPTLESGQLA